MDVFNGSCPTGQTVKYGCFIFSNNIALTQRSNVMLSEVEASKKSY
jgi:hypothetical protein